MKLTDVDQDRAKRLAARDMLNSLLETTPGVRTFENIAVPEDVLAAMPQEQQQMYLLYKIIQSEAAKKARDRKKQTAMDPLELLGAVTSPQTARAF
jgi:ABC-type branched-subunit amino acid transport system ATPase component